MFNFNLYFFLITILFLLISSFLDLKYREVSNKLILYFLIISIVSKIIHSLILLDFYIILNSLICFIITFVVLFLLWEFGVIAGADLKILLVISIFNPFNLVFFSKDLFIIFKAVLPLTLLLLGFLILLPYILVYSLFYLLSKKFYLIKNIFIDSFWKDIFNSLISLYLVNLILKTFLISLNYLYLFILGFLFILLLNKIKFIIKNKFYYLVFTIYLIVFIFNFFISKVNIFIFKDVLETFLFLLLISFIIKLYFLIKNNVLLSSKKISNLKEGDVISKNYYLIGNKLIIRKIGFFKQIKLLLKNNYYDNLKIDSNKAGGLNSSDIKFLKTMYENNVIGDSIYIKKTIAFTPVLLVSYILLNVFGDFIWLILI